MILSINKFKQYITTPVSKIVLSTIVVLYLFMLNFVSNNSISTIISSFWVALLMLVVTLIFSLLPKLFFRLFLASQILITSLCVFAKYSYGVTLTTDIMLSGLISESDLTLEMVSWQMIAWLLVTGVLPILWLFIVKIKPVSFFHHLFHELAVSTICFAIIFTYFCSAGYNFRDKGSIRDPRFVTDLSNFSPLDAEYSLHRAQRAYKKLKAHQSTIEKTSSKYNYKAQIDDLLVVLVIGETTRGDHLGLNGYEKNTTPKLNKIKNLYSFLNATSCDTLTINSLYCLTSSLTRSDASRLPSESSVGEVLQSLGYGSEIYSLQTMSDFYNYLGYDKLVSKYDVLREQQLGSKDIALLPYAKQAINNHDSGNKLIVLHTLGSHQTYTDRITTRHEVFKPFCTNPDVSKCSPSELNNAYDNTVVSVDDFLNNVIHQLKNKKAVLIYVSDHGESLGEKGQYFHGQPVNTAPPEQFSIPFVVWFSDKYVQDDIGQKNGHNLQKNWQSNKIGSYTVSHDNIFHSLLGCAGISSVDGLGMEASLNLCE